MYEEPWHDGSLYDFRHCGVVKKDSSKRPGSLSKKSLLSERQSLRLEVDSEFPLHPSGCIKTS